MVTKPAIHKNPSLASAKDFSTVAATNQEKPRPQKTSAEGFSPKESAQQLT